MTLSPPAAREAIHTRQVTCQGYRRGDGLWDIEGHLTDVKTYGFDNNDRGRIEAGEPIHEMWIRLTIDDDFTVRAIEAVTSHGPYRNCPAITPNYQAVVGLKITTGWTRAVKQRLSGVHGCTHLTELLGPVATTAFQTIFPLRMRERRELAKAKDRTPADGAPPSLLNTCHIYASNGDYVRRNWPEHYTGEQAAE